MLPKYYRKFIAALHNHLPLLALTYCALSMIASRTAGDPQAASPPLDLGRSSIAATFHGLRSSNGYLRVSLYDRSDDFPNGMPVARRDIALQTLDPKTPLDSLSVTFEGLRPGTYAVCSFHDRKGSGKLTQNFLGIPQEEWGMSNDPRPRFRAPRFNEARFDLSVREEKNITITMHK
jgi:uncharacterized protein (DUF2141 family)